jgi:hypothetical protein
MAVGPSGSSGVRVEDEGRRDPAPARPSLPPLSRSQIGWAIAIGIPAILIVVYWIAVSEIPARVYISSWSFSMPGILLLAVMLLVARWVGPRLRRQLFDHRQMLLIYLMVSVSGLFTGYSLLQTLLPALGGLTWQAQTETSWTKLWPHIPTWLAPMDREATRGMFVGNSPVPWRAWIVPLAWWFLFFIAASGAMLFLAILLSRQWIHRERLTFPIAQLPIEVTSPSRAIFRNRLLWLGFVIPVVLESLLALNFYYPNIPAIVMKHRDMAPDWFPERPYSALRPFVVGFTPFIVALAYLSPVDVSFSIWFFALGAKLARLYVAMKGMDAAEAGAVANRFPFREEQAFGAFVAFGLAVLWRSTGSGGRVVRWWGGGVGSSSGDEQRRSRHSPCSPSVNTQPPHPLSPHALCLAGFLLCSAVTVGFMAAAHMPLWVAAAMWVGTLLIGVTLARIRAEAGPAWVFGPYRDVGRAIAVAWGTASFSEPALVGLGAFRWLNRDPRFLPMAFQMEALKMADTVGLRRRLVVPLILAATAMGVAAGFYAILTLSYHLGLGTANTAPRR